MALSAHLLTILQNKETMEFIRLGIVYAHLLACCVAVGMVLTSDIAMVKQLLKGQSARQSSEHLAQLRSSVAIALAALWISGLAIIALDAASAGMQYFLNPKLQAKIGIVVLLTLNGVVLHNLVLPALQRTGSLLELPIGMRHLAIFSGAFSAVSWFYAALLGVGRPLAWKYSLAELMAAYPLLILSGILFMLILVRWSSERARQDDRQWSVGSSPLAH